jgi:hypothetical protein
VRFPIRKIKAVHVKSDKEFDLVIGSSKNSRRYQLRGSSQQAKIWVTAIEAMISKFANCENLAAGGSVESIASSSVDVGGDTIGDVSSHTASTHVAQTGGMTSPSDPIWEQPEIGTEEIDALFSDWFVFLDDPRSEIKAGRMIDAASRAVSDLWSVIGNLHRGEDVSFDEARVPVTQRISLSPLRFSVTVGEYVVRICQKFLLWLNRGSADNRRSMTDDIPVLVEWIARFERNLNELFPGKANASETPDDLDDSRYFSKMHATPEKWKRGLKILKQKFGSEWEILLIESVQISLPPESVWDMPPNTQGSCHGPAKTSSLPTKYIPQQTKPILTSSWIRDFLLIIGDKCLSRSTRGTLWSVAYPTCIDLLTFHCTNATIASMNTCWREFRSRSQAISGYKKFGKLGKAIRGMKRITGRLSVTAGSPPPPQHRSSSTGSIPSPLASPSAAIQQVNMFNFLSARVRCM